jgi:hypothetical protein
MPQMPETAIHGGFTLIKQHFISEITDFPQQPHRPKPFGAQGCRHRNANRTDEKIFYLQFFQNSPLYLDCKPKRQYYKEE